MFEKLFLIVYGPFYILVVIFKGILNSPNKNVYLGLFVLSVGIGVAGYYQGAHTQSQEILRVYSVEHNVPLESLSIKDGKIYQTIKIIETKKLN